MKNYRITLPINIIKILETDQSYFNFDVKNELYSRIIKNYYNKFPINRKRINKIEKVLKNKISSKHLDAVVKELIEIDIKPARLKRGIKTDRISFKVTNNTSKHVEKLEEILLKYDFESMIYILREIFISYANLRLLDKEKIVLQDEISELKIAISKQFETKIKYKGKVMIIYPYLLTNPIDDFSSYLLAEDIEDPGKIKALKLSEIKIKMVDEFESFTISPNKEIALNKYRTKEISIFNSKNAEEFLKVLEANDLGYALPYLLDEARNNHDEKIDLSKNVSTKKQQS